MVASTRAERSSKNAKIKNYNQTKKASDKELTFEAISLGKASNDSGSTAKRGRPRQNPLKIQTSK